MPHKGNTLEIVKPSKKFGKTQGGKVMHLPTHDTTSKIHAMDHLEKEQTIKNAYLGKPQDQQHLPQTAS